MLKAILQSVFLILTSLTLVLLTGCTDPAKARAKQLQEAADLHSSGNSDAALQILEQLAQQNPDDSGILQKIGEIYQTQGNTTMAAFYLDQAYQKAPDNVDLLYKTYLAQVAANEPASQLLESIANQAPEAMSAALWIQLGNDRYQANQPQAALEAYLKGVNPEIETPEPATSAAIGNLFLQLENQVQAERWFKMAAESDDPNALTALFGMLEIKLTNKDWPGAEAIILRLDKQFPGAVDASDWASARSELKRWRDAQDAMQAELAKAEAARKAAAEAKAQAEKNKAEAAQQAATDAANAKEQEAKTTQATELAADQSTDAKSPSEPANKGTTGKAQVLADLEAAEAIADTPALETTPAIAFDPNIAIEPADPAVSFDVSYDQQDDGASTEYTISSDSAPSSAQTVTEAKSTPRLQQRSLGDLLDDADQASLERDHETAIRLYWQALGQANSRADIWNRLSQAYLADSQVQNAETTALEAIRLEPREVNYTLDYLRVAQRSKQPAQFLAELETAYDRFPRSPEVALSLARAYERVGNNSTAARSLYQRFIEIAPKHPLRSEADAAINRLR